MIFVLENNTGLVLEHFWADYRPILFAFLELIISTFTYLQRNDNICARAWHRPSARARLSASSTDFVYSYPIYSYSISKPTA